MKTSIFFTKETPPPTVTMVTTESEALDPPHLSNCHGNKATACARFEFVYIGVILGSVCVLGYVGNTMCLVVLHMTRRTSTVTLFLLKALACTDLFYILFYSIILVWPK